MLLEQLPRSRCGLLWSCSILPRNEALGGILGDKLFVPKYLEHIAGIDEGIDAIKNLVADSIIWHAKSDLNSHKRFLSFACIFSSKILGEG
jgi:hypothetical protein